MRLFNNEVTRKDGKLGFYVLHLHHTKGSGLPTPGNEEKFQNTINQRIRYAASGVREVTEL